MPKNDETQIILDYIVDNVALTGYGEDGDEFVIPSYVRVDDIVTEFNVDEDDIVEIAKDEGYLIFDNKADIAEGLYIAHPDLDIETFKDDFKNYYDAEADIEIVFQPEVEDEIDVKETEVEIEDEDESLEEDTVKQGSHWVNKGKEGTHGKFKTKKAADAQRKAMFANGYKESLEDNDIIKLDDVTAFWDSDSFNDEGEEYFYEIEYHADEDGFIYGKVMDTTTLDCSREDMKAAGVDVEDIEAKLKAKLGNAKIDEDYEYTYWCVSDGVNPRRSMIFTSEEPAIETAKANPRFKFVDKVVNGNPTTIWERGKEEVTESAPSKRVEWCIMDKLGNNAFGCYDTEEEAMKVCKSEPEAFSVVGVEYGDDGEEISASTIYEKDWDNDLNEAKEPKIEIPEDFDGRMDFLAADEQEAIDGYDLIIAALGEDEANVKEQLEKIRIEEVAHKEFLEKVKADHNLVYTEPLEPETEVEVEDEVELEEDKKKVTSEDIDKFINDIYALRKESIANEGEFGIGNLVFKEARALGYLDHLKDLKHQLRSQELSLESLTEAHETPTDDDIKFLRDWLNLGKESYLKGFDEDNQTAFIVFPKYVTMDNFKDEGNIADALRSRGFNVDLNVTDYTYKSVGQFNSREMRTTGKGYDRTLKNRVRMDISWAPHPLDEELNTSKYNTKDKLAQLRKEIEEDGTYSADEKGNLTREELKDGFMVSFFRPEIKDSDIAVILKTIGTKLGSPYLGIFEDAPEISYRFDDEDRAMKFAKLFNQQSIWDNENMTEIANPDFKKNGKVRYSSVLDKVREFINPSIKPVDEAYHRDTITLYYPNLEITTWTKTSDAVLYPVDNAHPAEYDDEDIEIEYEYEADKDEVINALYELICDKDEWAEKDENEIIKYVEDNLDALVEDNMDYLCDYFIDSARSQAEDNYEAPEYEPEYDED